VLRQGIVLAAIGAVVGTAAALALNRSLRTFVYGVGTTDPLTYGCVAVLLIATAALASFVPALRAVRLNPVAALRE
jgi:ABC-type antimicrobial peptide transport system permease subunit